MTAQTYSYEITGLAADDQMWTVCGEVSTTSAGEFMAAVETAMRESFEQLTRGRAVYGKPGAGCHGPYRITKLLIEVAP